jgi:hypothetical protein
MTVIEAIKEYKLEDHTKSYRNLYGNNIDLKYPLDTLAKMEVKDIYINLITEQTTITIIAF